MAKRRGQLQIAVDKIDAQIADLQRVRGILCETLNATLVRRKPKAEKLRPVGADVKVS